MALLEIKNLHAKVEEKEILKGINLTVQAGEVHAIMGPNGSGKSTLANVLAGRENYEVTAGEVLYEGKSLLEMDVEERARSGIFLAFQYPIEIPGVSNATFLRMAYNTMAEARGLDELDPLEFDDVVREKCRRVEMDPGLLERSVNELRTALAHLLPGSLAAHEHHHPGDGHIELRRALHLDAFRARARGRDRARRARRSLARAPPSTSRGARPR